MDDATTPLDELKGALARFNAERGWGRFHTPLHLAMALSAEAGELLELFLWKREDEVPDRTRLGEEMADVLICLSNLARRLDLDLMRAVEDKIAKNAERYPVAKAFGRADKWDVLARGGDAGGRPADESGEPAAVGRVEAEAAKDDQVESEQRRRVGNSGLEVES